MKNAATATARSQALSLAWSIRRQNQFLTWGQCQAQAWKVVKLRAALHAGKTTFTYQKNDGEVRQAVGTLNAGFFSYTNKGSDRAELPTVVKYFDLEKNAFRSFRAERILSIAA